MTDVERLDSINQRVDGLNQKKIGAQKEAELLRKQYDTKVQELNQLGITDVKNLPQVISDLKAQVQEKMTAAETRLGELETVIGS